LLIDVKEEEEEEEEEAANGLPINKGKEEK
jgi:hypothetical protein